MSSGHAVLHLQLQALPPPPLRFGSVLFPSYPIQSKRIRNSSFSLRLYHNGSKSSVFGRKSGVIKSSVAEEANGAAEPKHKQQVTVERPYPFHEIELKWQRYWEENQTFRTPDEIDTSKPKYYVLDMFPYPRSLYFSQNLCFSLFNLFRVLGDYECKKGEGPVLLNQFWTVKCFLFSFFLWQLWLCRNRKSETFMLIFMDFCSGAGLHVGHPLGYTATDILARLKRMQGYNVLHPMGWDAFGLPAEQYAIEVLFLQLKTI